MVIVYMSFMRELVIENSFILSAICIIIIVFLLWSIYSIYRERKLSIKETMQNIKDNIDDEE
jgi:hypothetical protein